MLIRVDHQDMLNALRDSLRVQLERHGYRATETELKDIARNAAQAVVLLDKEST